MLLEDLIDTKQKERRVKSLSDVQMDKRRIQNSENGFFGGVKDKKDDPHLVQKSNYLILNKEEDGYWNYIKYISDNKLSDSNPYFPRVYSLKTVADARNNLRYKADIEKLIPFDQMTEEEIEFLHSKIFEEGQNPPKTPPRFTKFMEENPQEKFASQLRDLVRNHRNSNDENLNAAVDILYTILEIINDNKKDQNYQPFIDVKMDNMMLRRTPQGVQIVFTDPIA